MRIDDEISPETAEALKSACAARKPSQSGRGLAAACLAALLWTQGAAAQEAAPQASPPPPPAEAAECVEDLGVRRSWPGAAEIRVSSTCRAEGETIALVIDSYAFTAAFDAQGQANAVVPLFGRLTLLNWRDADGGPRAELLEFPDYDRSIQIALIWAGEAELNLSLRESPGFFKTEAEAGPEGDVGPDRPNLELDQGYGRMILADRGGSEGDHAQVYVLEGGRNPVLRGQRDRARIEPRVLANLEDDARREACRVLAESGERAHFTIHVNLYGQSRVERQALGAAACDAEASAEARTMRAEPVDFSAER